MLTCVQRAADHPRGTSGTLHLTQTQGPYAHVFAARHCHWVLATIDPTVWRDPGRWCCVPKAPGDFRHAPTIQRLARPTSATTRSGTLSPTPGAAVENELDVVVLHTAGWVHPPPQPRPRSRRLRGPLESGSPQPHTQSLLAPPPPPSPRLQASWAAASRQRRQRRRRPRMTVPHNTAAPPPRTTGQFPATATWHRRKPRRRRAASTARSPCARRR